MAAASAVRITQASFTQDSNSRNSTQRKSVKSEAHIASRPSRPAMVPVLERRELILKQWLGEKWIHQIAASNGVRRGEVEGVLKKHVAFLLKGAA